MIEGKGLAYMHKMGIVHGDVSMSMVLMDTPEEHTIRPTKEAQQPQARVRYYLLFSSASKIVDEDANASATGKLDYKQVVSCQSRKLVERLLWFDIFELCYLLGTEFTDVCYLLLSILIILRVLMSP